MSDEPIVLAPTELTQQAIENLVKRVKALGVGDCESATLRAAQAIAEPSSDGKSANVYAVLPQLAQDVLRGKEAKINIDGNETVDVPELTAAMIAAARIAHRTGMALADVSVDDIAKEEPEIHKLLIQEKEPTCRPPKATHKPAPRAR